jgi:response regulator of citrate/malate metabolism
MTPGSVLRLQNRWDQSVKQLCFVQRPNCAKTLSNTSNLLTAALKPDVILLDLHMPDVRFRNRLKET